MRSGSIYRELEVFGEYLRQLMSPMGLGCVKTQRHGKLIEEISPRTTIGAIAISERGRL
jgi:hypothetical protein